jgi:tRNA-specific 2-thiouridylase
LLKEAGYEVTGVYMQLFPGRNYSIPDLENIESLEHICQMLDIPLHKLDLETEFHQLVIDYFCQEYERGYTPNPCVVCNHRVKFGLLLDKALQMGADYLATGHYAYLKPSPHGYQLTKAFDRSKDQSYFLYRLGQEVLNHLKLPIGNRRKAEVGRLAAQLNLSTTRQRDSQDICFIPDKDYRSFIAKHILLKPGDVVDHEGRVLGKHEGLALYTVGQRHRLRLNAHHPLHVMRLDAVHNRVIVAPRDHLFSNRLRASQLSWVSGQAPTTPISITAKIRYQSPDTTANLALNNGVAEVNFTQPQWAIAPGQSIVFYRDNAVLGGGIIEDAG